MLGIDAGSHMEYLIVRHEAKASGTLLSGPKQKHKTLLEFLPTLISAPR